jgi:hypothetical protein
MLPLLLTVECGRTIISLNNFRSYFLPRLRIVLEARQLNKAGCPRWRKTLARAVESPRVKRRLASSYVWCHQIKAASGTRTDAPYEEEEEVAPGNRSAFIVPTSYHSSHFGRRIPTDFSSCFDQLVEYRRH